MKTMGEVTRKHHTNDMKTPYLRHENTILTIVNTENKIAKPENKIVKPENRIAKPENKTKNILHTLNTLHVKGMQDVFQLRTEIMIATTPCQSPRSHLFTKGRTYETNPSPHSPDTQTYTPKVKD